MLISFRFSGSGFVKVIGHMAFVKSRHPPIHIFIKSLMTRQQKLPKNEMTCKGTFVKRYVKKTTMMTICTNTHHRALNNHGEEEHDSEHDRLPFSMYSSFINTINVSALLFIEGTPKRTKVSRRSSMFDQRLQWDTFCAKYAGRQDFQRHLRMSAESFAKLVSFVRHALAVNHKMAALRGGSIPAEICVYSCVRYLAGGSYSDIRFFTGVSTASLYRIIWKCVDAINACPDLDIRFPRTNEEVIEAARGFQTISTQGCIWNCISVVDGYHLQIVTPSKTEVRNVRSFFSGHYQTYGLNIQAACDHHCRFTYLGIAGPGVMGDRDAINQVTLGAMVENLSGLYCVIGDCAYTATEHMIPIYRNAEKLKRQDNFNFFASQLRIRIEMAFGLMVKKWAILTRPLSLKMRKIKRLMVAIARLHNFCINERLASQRLHTMTRTANSDEVPVYTPRNVSFSAQETMLRENAADFEYEEMELAFENAWSMNRDRMAREIECLQLTRPGSVRNQY